MVKGQCSEAILVCPTSQERTLTFSRRRIPMAATSMNNSVRKTLASQLDRLDGILDALSEGLNEAISDGVKAAVGEAVRQAVVEVLTNEELRRHLQAPIPQPPPAVPAEAEVGGNWLAR